MLRHSYHFKDPTQFVPSIQIFGDQTEGRDLRKFQRLLIESREQLPLYHKILLYFEWNGQESFGF